MLIHNPLREDYQALYAYLADFPIAMLKRGLENLQVQLNYAEVMGNVYPSWFVEGTFKAVIDERWAKTEARILWKQEGF